MRNTMSIVAAMASMGLSDVARASSTVVGHNSLFEGLGALPGFRSQSSSPSVEEIKASGSIPKYLYTAPGSNPPKTAKKKRLKKPQGRKQ